jgi:hypothetical protein
MGQCLLIIGAVRSHPETSHSVEILRTSDQTDAEICTWQHTTLRTRQTSTALARLPQSQEESGRRPTPETARPLGSARDASYKTSINGFNCNRNNYNRARIYLHPCECPPCSTDTLPSVKFAVTVNPLNLSTYSTYHLSNLKKHIFKHKMKRLPFHMFLGSEQLFTELNKKDYDGLCPNS